MPVPSRKARDGTTDTKPFRLVESRSCRGRPFFGRTADCSLQNPTESLPNRGFLGIIPDGGSSLGVGMRGKAADRAQCCDASGRLIESKRGIPAQAPYLSG